MATLLSQAEQNAIIAKLQEKGVKADKCPMCGNNHFIVADGYYNQSIASKKAITDNSGTVYYLGGPSIPSIAIVCTNCGFMSQHSLGILGLLNP